MESPPFNMVIASLSFFFSFLFFFSVNAPLGGKIINHDTYKAICTVELEWRLLSNRLCCVASRNQALRCCFFVARGAVDLPREEEACYDYASSECRPSAYTFYS